MREATRTPATAKGLAQGQAATHGRAPTTASDRRVLLPGQLYFGREYRQLSTLLGSCVAVGVWHPVRRLGGMCHFLLPSRQRQPGAALDGRFGNEALELMMAELQRSGTSPAEYQAHLYGGADTMPDHVGVKLNIGERNIDAGWHLIDHYGLSLETVDVGDRVPRTVTLDLDSGECLCRRGAGGVR